MNNATFNVEWQPQCEERGLALSLGMVQLHELSLEIHNHEIRCFTHEGELMSVVGRWQVWQVVRVMAEHRLTNTREGRQAAFRLLYGLPSRPIEQSSTTEARETRRKA